MTSVFFPVVGWWYQWQHWITKNFTTAWPAEKSVHHLAVLLQQARRQAQTQVQQWWHAYGAMNDVDMEDSMAMGIPKNGWFVRENPNRKWMMTGGTPLFGNHHMISETHSVKPEGAPPGTWQIGCRRAFIASPVVPPRSDSSDSMDHYGLISWKLISWINYLEIMDIISKSKSLISAGNEKRTLKVSKSHIYLGRSWLLPIRKGSRMDLQILKQIQWYRHITPG